MKKLTLLLCCLGSMMALNLNAANYVSPDSEPQNQEKCVTAPCLSDTVCNQLPCTVPENTVCTPAPCVAPINASNTYTLPCDPAPCVAPANATNSGTAPATSSTTTTQQPQSQNTVYCGGC